MKNRLSTRSAQSILLDLNIGWLRQALALLNRLDDASYTAVPAGFAPHRAGGHLRHIIEFYRCFLDGLPSSHVDYDARRRDLSLEQNRLIAASAIRQLIYEFETSYWVRERCIVWVRMEDADVAQ